MFPVNQLARFEVNDPTYRLLKPWWEVCTDYLSAAILLIAVLSGAMQATQGNLFCLPAVDCNFERNQSMQAPGSNSFCTTYNYSAAIRGSTMTVLIKLQDRRQYDFVEAECGQKAVHWFASHFPLIIFIQAIILIIVDNFWIKFPQTSSILEHFVSLVIECYNTPGTCLAVSNALWGTNISEENKVSHDIEQGSHDRQPLLRSTSKTDGGSVKPLQLDTGASLEVSEAIKAKSLYEKMRQFRVDVEEKQGHLTLRWIYLAQAIAQLFLSLFFLIFNACFHSKLNKTVECNIDDIISENYNYFKCSNVLVPYFQVTLVIFYLLIVPYFLSCIFICFWTFLRRKKDYDFKKAHQVTEDKNRNYTSQLSDIRAASGDLAFMLHLLDEYNKLYSLKFAVFLSEKNEKKLKDFILLNEWPIEKLQKNTEDGGRTLKLTNLRGIPKTVFEMEELDSLILENFPLTDDDFVREDWLKLHLRSLSLIKCCLTSIPAAILELSNLETLDLSLNSIESIPEEISKLGDLHTLNIASNNVTKGVEHIIAMENLRRLNLRENNSLELQLPPCRPKLMRVQVNEVMFQKMTEETRKTLENIIVTEVPSARDISVIQYLPDKAPHIEKVRKNIEKVYKMTSKPKGLALIINISDYDDYNRDQNLYTKLVKRSGSEVDVEKLQKLFNGIGYQVRNISQDSVRTMAMFHNELSTLLKDNRSSDSIILVMMAHGNEEGMYLKNGEIISVEQIIAILQIDSLEGKPKLVFIQSCRGTKMTGVSLSPRSKVLVEEKTDAATAATDSLEEPTLNVNLPPYPDVLIAYSFLKGYVSLRNTQNGTRFIQSLVEVFSNYAWEEDVLSLLTYVNYEVSRKLTMCGYKQVPAPQSTLTKKLFFLPGYFEDD